MMELSSAQHHQEMATDSLENMLICTKAQQERKPRPQQEQALKCPRCDSTNTKFCYYNNYSLTQPRYFCKSCRRYWTNGGTLRNVPVGGGCRKNKRPSSSKRSANSDHHHQPQPHHHLLLNSSSDHHTSQSNPLSAFSSQMSSYDNDQYHHQAACSDLSLVFARLQKQTSGGYDQFDHHGQEQNHSLSLLGNYTNSHFGNIMGLNNANNIVSGGGGHHGFLEGLKANLLEQTHFQNNNSFHNLYNGGYGSNNNSTSMSNISGSDQIMIPYEDLSTNSSFGTSKTSGLLKQEDNNINQLNNNGSNNRSSQILWGGAAAFPWHQLNPSNINGHDIDQHNNMVDNGDLVIRENMNNVFAAAAPVWQGLINSPLM